MSRLRIAVIGVGVSDSSRARAWLDTVSKLNHIYDLCAICDRGEDSLKAAGDRFGVEARHTDVLQLLSQKKPDAVLVLVPTEGQTVVALEAIRHDCHVITEIPYALTLDMGDAIDRAAREKGLKWEVAENVWVWPREQMKQKIVKSGLLGKITHTRLWYPAGSYHGLNAIRKILDREPRRALGYARAMEVPTYQNYGGGDETTRWWESAVIEFEDDVVCLYEMPPDPTCRSSHWDIEGLNGCISGNEVILYGDGSRKSIRIEEIFEEIHGERILTGMRLRSDPPVAWENPYKDYGVSGQDDVARASILESLHGAVTENADLIYGPAEGRKDYEMWIALRESADQGNVWVDMPLSESTDLENRIRQEWIQSHGGDPVVDHEKLINANFGRLSAMWTVAGWL